MIPRRRRFGPSAWAFLIGALSAQALHSKSLPSGSPAFFSHGSTSTTKLSNAYVEIAVNPSGLFTIGTKGGDPDRATDDNKKLLYGHPSPGTSYSTIRIDGSDYTFGSAGTHLTDIQASGNSIATSYRINSIIEVTQTLTIVPSRGTCNSDTVEIRYTLKNVDAVSHNVGARVMLDTMLGDNDGAPFRVPGAGALTTDKEFNRVSSSTNPAIPDLSAVLDSLTSPSVVALLSFKDPSLTEPDRVVFGYWSAVNASWDYAVNTSRSFLDNNGDGTITGSNPDSDSALLAWWGYNTPLALAAGASVDVGFYYGLGGYSVSSGGGLSVGLLSAGCMNVSVSSLTYTYTPDPLTLTAFILNNSGKNIAGSYARLDLPAEFTLDASQTATRPLEKNSGTALLPTGEAAEISWSVRANGRKTGRRRIGLSVQGADGSASQSKSVLVPGIANAIWGEVTGPNGELLPGVQVTAFQGGSAFGAPGLRPSLGPVSGAAVTQSNGRYIISNLSPGIYTVRISGSGLETVYSVATVTADGSGDGTSPVHFGATTQSGVETFPYPNPVRDGSVQIAFYASAGGDAEIKVYNAAGEVVQKETVSVPTAGWWNVPWKIEAVATGIYFYSVELGGSIGKGKIAVLKKRSKI